MSPSATDALVRKLTGRHRYVSDLATDADLHAALVYVRGPGALTVPPAHRLRSRLPSGVQVLTAAELPPGVAAENSLLGSAAAYPGQPVAIVVADTPARARAVARSAEAELGTVLVATAGEPGGPVELLVDEGPAAGGDRDWLTVEHTVRVAPAAHAALESRAAVAVPLPGHRVQVHTNAQDPQSVAEQVRRQLGDPGLDVVVTKHDEGGAFGGKQDPWWEPVLCWLALTRRASVSLCPRPWEHLLAGPSRHGFEVTAGVSVDPGSLAVCAWRLDVAIDSGDGANHVRSIAMTVLDTFRTMLPAAAHTFTARSVHSVRPPGTAYRGYGVPWALAAFDVALRKASGRLGCPKERLLAALCAAAPGVFRPPLLDRLAPLPVRPWASTGVSVAALATGMPGHPDDVSGCRLTLTADRRALVVTGSPDGGTGSHAGLRAGAGRLCGVPADRVDVAVDAALVDGGKRAQRSTYMSVLAVRDAYRTACECLRDQLAERFGTPVSTVRTAGGVLLEPRGGPRLPVVDWLARLGVTVTADGRAANTEPPLSSAACRVSIVDDGGVPGVDALAMVVDAGRIAAADGAFGQVYGGIGWGIGSVLVEGGRWNPQWTLREHGVTRSGDLPRVLDVRLFDRVDRYDRLPHGIGEVPMLPVVGALADALYQLRGDQECTTLPDAPGWRQR